MDVSLIASVLSIAVRSGTSVLLAVLGIILSERSGVLNLGVEGIMLVAAMASFAGAFYSGSLLVGMVCGMLAGGAMGLLHAIWCVTLRTNQVASGLALVILGTGLSDFLGRALVGQIGPKFERVPLPLLSNLPVIGQALFNQDLLTYGVMLLVPLLWFFLYRTQPGIHLRAVGDNPRAADALGLNVVRLRYLYTVLGGMFIGLGGAHLSLAYTPGWNTDITSGRGWIAVALVIFAMWNPLRASVGALLFGGVTAIQYRMQAAGTPIPAFFLNMLPYVATILALAVMNRRESRSAAPATLGVPYYRE